MGVEPKIGVGPPNYPFLIGFSIIFTIPFGGFPPIFGNTLMFTHCVLFGTDQIYNPTLWEVQSTMKAEWSPGIVDGEPLLKQRSFRKKNIQKIVFGRPELLQYFR